MKEYSTKYGNHVNISAGSKVGKSKLKAATAEEVKDAIQKREQVWKPVVEYLKDK